MRSNRIRLVLTALVALVLGSCNGGAAPPASSGALTPPLALPAHVWAPETLSAINTYPGAVNGTDNLFSPQDGDAKSGGHGSVVDRRIPCLPSMGNGYHIHIFLGIIYKGSLVAMPDAIGMVRPGPATNGFVNAAQCYYLIHTHDSSGIVHVENPNVHPPSAILYKLRNVLDVWGVPHSANSFGPFHGHILTFVGNVPLKQTVVSSYSRYNGSYEFVPLQSHEVIWIEIGKPFYAASQLPPVTFYLEY